MLPTEAWAQPFHLETRFTQAGNGGQETRFDPPVQSTTWPVSLANTFSGSLSDDNASGSTTAAATASATFDNTILRLGVFAAVDVSNVDPEPAASEYHGQAHAINVFRDSITLLGGSPGTTGFLRVVLGLTGTFDATGSCGGQAGAGSSAELSVAMQDSIGSTGVVGISLAKPMCVDPFFAGFPVPLPEAMTVDFQYTFGDGPRTFGLDVMAIATTFAFQTATGRATVNFMNTVSVLSMQVLDANKEPVPGGTVESVNDFPYPIAAPGTDRCSILQSSGRKSDVDVFRFDGTVGEQIVLTLDKNPAGVHTGDQATLGVADSIRGVTLALTDSGPLPRVIATTLPGTGRYLVSVSELAASVPDRFRGAYCLSLQSSGAAQDTFAPHSGIE